MIRSLLLPTLVLTAFAIMRAGDNLPVADAAEDRERFDSGATELELFTGLVGAPIAGNHTSYHYTDSELRLGWMLFSPRGSGFFRGNLELLANGGGGAIFEGPGTLFGSLGVILRYNFIQPSAKLIPYFQIGAGTFISDISENRQQEDIGGTFEADLKSGLGTRFLLGRNWSLNTELFFEHISNADTQTRNVGLNALGGLVGISRSF